MSGHRPWSEISAKVRADPERRARIEQGEQAIEVGLTISQLRAARGATQKCVAERSQAMRITSKEMSTLPFQSYRKVASFRVRARRLTEEDVEQRGEVILTMEGPAAFRPGDYLARGIQGEEYPIRPEAFAILYEAQPIEPGTEGFAWYRPVPLIHQAVQIAEPFTVEQAEGGFFAGKAGDYLVRTVGLEGARIVDSSIFEQTYERIVDA